LKHKLLLLNLLLLVLIVLAGLELRRRWHEEKVYEEQVLRKRIPVAAPPVIQPAPKVSPVAPAKYADIASQMLFAKDRNPNVFIEPPKPPPPEVMPPLPFYYGYMDFGGGPTVMMAEKAGGKQKGYHLNDAIGSFKLLAVNNREVLFQWKDKKVLKRLDELVDKQAAVAAAQAPPAAAASKPTAAPPPPPPAEAKPSAVSIGADLKACQPGDSSPAGTIADGYKKVTSATPFGQSCRWEAVK
jgi:hypothetical protein